MNKSVITSDGIWKKKASMKIKYTNFIIKRIIIAGFHFLLQVPSNNIK